MKASSLLGSLLAALVSARAAAQPNIPYIVQLPSQDFVWTWGTQKGTDALARPEFELHGHEQNFACTLTGSFRPGSHMSDFSNLRDFEQTLNNTLYFIQDATTALNEYYRSVDLDWAKLDCIIPQGEISEEKEQQRLEKAVERAERARERRRERAENDD